jgi:hypothetical protein
MKYTLIIAALLALVSAEQIEMERAKQTAKAHAKHSKKTIKNDGDDDDEGSLAE